MVGEQWETLSLNVLANDTDADNDVLSITGATFDATKVQVTRVVSNNIGIKLDIVPVAAGLTTVQYSITDNRGGVDTASISISIARSACTNC